MAGSVARSKVIKTHRPLVERLALAGIKKIDVAFRRLAVRNDQANVGAAGRNFRGAVEGCPQAIFFHPRLFLVMRAHGAKESTV